MGGSTDARHTGGADDKVQTEIEQRLRRKVVRSLYSALLHLTHDYDKNVHPRKQPWLEIDPLLSAFGTVPTEFGMLRSMRDVFASKKGETNPEEIERLINEGFTVLKHLSTCYSDIIPWASLFLNKMDRERIDRDVMPEDGVVTVARLAGRKVQVEDIRAELDRIARLVEQKLDDQQPHTSKAREEELQIQRWCTTVRTVEENEWKLNPWEEQTFGKECDHGDAAKEEAWRLDPFQVTLPRACVYGERMASQRPGADAPEDEHDREDRKRRKAEEVLDTLNQVLYDDLGLYGVPGEQWNQPEVNFIDSVLRLKGGIPLSLSVIYMGVARRLGVQMHGVNVPSHFLLYSPDVDAYIDAYNNGKRLTPHEATDFTAVLLRHSSASSPLVHKSPQLRFSRQDLEAQKTGTFGICTRMVRNLYAASVNDYGSGSEEAQRWMRQLAILQNW